MRLPHQTAYLLFCAALIPLAGCDLAYPAAEGKFERTLQVTGSVDLDVTTGSGGIDVRTGGSSVVQVYGHIRASNDWRSDAEEKVRYLTANPPVEQTANIIRIGRIENEAYRNNVSISYEIVVPEQTTVRLKTGSGSERIASVHGPVDASTGSGSITMSGIGDEVKAHTGSGSIQIDGAAGRVEVSTGSGSIRAERISGPIAARTGSGSMVLDQVPGGNGDLDVEASTGSGRIELSGVHGSLHASTGSGGITASGFPAGDWKLSASSGSITTHLDAGAAFDLYAHASSGNITVDYPVTVTGTFVKHELRGKVRGGGPLIEAHTSSGSIAIR